MNQHDNMGSCWSLVTQQALTEETVFEIDPNHEIDMCMSPRISLCERRGQLVSNSLNITKNWDVIDIVYVHIYKLYTVYPLVQ